MKRKERPKSNKKPYYLSTHSIIGIHISFGHFVLLLLTDQLFRCRFAIRLLLLRLLLLAHTHLHIYTHTYISEHNRFIYNIIYVRVYQVRVESSECANQKYLIFVGAPPKAKAFLFQAFFYDSCVRSIFRNYWSSWEMLKAQPKIECLLTLPYSRILQ